MSLNKTKRERSVSSSHSHHSWALYAIRFMVLFLAFVCGILQWNHVSNLHENDLFYSHLSEKERELTFRTESGFYYSYYKQLLNAPSLLSGWNSLTSDPRSEFPHCFTPSNSSVADNGNLNRSCSPLNAMKRFNLYPELILAVVYRTLSSFDGLLSRDCYHVSRDVPAKPLGLSVDPKLFQSAMNNASILLVPNQPLEITTQSIISCVGPGEPSYFYVNCVFVLSGLILVSLAWSGWSIGACSLCCPHSSTIDLLLPIWASILPVAGYFYNHREATRVQWVPALRENFAYPFFTLQQSWLLHILGQPLSANTLPRWKSVFYCILLVCFQLPWQFAQFALSTQVASLFVATCLSVAPSYPNLTAHFSRLVCMVQRLIFIHIFALLFTVLFHFGNRLLLTSGYLPGLLGTFVGLAALLSQVSSKAAGTSARDSRANLGSSLSLRLLKYVFFPSLSAVCTAGVLGLFINRFLFPTPTDEHDGGHIFDLILEKLSPDGKYRTFHTKMYTCAPEFDFIGWKSLEQPISTGVLPATAILAFWVLGAAFCLLICPTVRSTDHSGTKLGLIWPKRNRPELAQVDFISVFVIIQLLFFTLMAGMIMRLKLFWTPHLCLCLALLAQPGRWRDLCTFISQLTEYIKSARSRECTSSNTTCHWPVWLAHTILATFLAYMTLPGTRNLQAELAIRGQFSAYDDEALLRWFESMPAPQPNSYHTPWVIAGPLSTLGGLRLMLPAAPPYVSTQITTTNPNTTVGFAFTNHPHYENAELRKRTVLAYSIYSRRSVSDVWHIYRHVLQANFIIVDTHSCLPRNGCSNPELYDLIDPHLSSRPSLCELLLTSTVLKKGFTPPPWRPYFHVVYVEFDSGRVLLFVKP